MADFADGKIQAFVGPQELGAADNLEQVIVDFINEAEDNLDIAVQELDSIPIAVAIIAARYRGVTVRMFIEQDYVFSPLPKKNTAPVFAPDVTEQDLLLGYLSAGDTKAGELDINRQILTALLRNGVDVKADYNPKIFHQKFIIRDYTGRARKTSAILTGSANFTQTDTHRNLNHIIIFKSARICEDYQTEFDEIRSGTFGAVNSRHRRSPRVVNVEGVPVQVLFAPDHAPELEIVKQMLKCSHRVDFAIFTFSGSSGIDDAMLMLRAANRVIRGALDPAQGRQYWAATDWLHNAGIEVYFPVKAGAFKTFRKLHHKLMVIDDRVVVAGSMNYTAPANEFNDENIFVIGSPYALKPGDGGPVDFDRCEEIVNFFRAEIDRIIAHSERYTPEA